MRSCFGHLVAEMRLTLFLEAERILRDEATTYTKRVVHSPDPRGSKGSEVITFTTTQRGITYTLQILLYISYPGGEHLPPGWSIYSSSISAEDILCAGKSSLLPHFPPRESPFSMIYDVFDADVVKEAFGGKIIHGNDQFTYSTNPLHTSSCRCLEVDEVCGWGLYECTPVTSSGPKVKMMIPVREDDERIGLIALPVGVSKEKIGRVCVMASTITPTNRWLYGPRRPFESLKSILTHPPPEKWTNAGNSFTVHTYVGVVSLESEYDSDTDFDASDVPHSQVRYIQG